MKLQMSPALSDLPTARKSIVRFRLSRDLPTLSAVAALSRQELVLLVHVHTDPSQVEQQRLSMLFLRCDRVHDWDQRSSTVWTLLRDREIFFFFLAKSITISDHQRRRIESTGFYDCAIGSTEINDLFKQKSGCVRLTSSLTLVMGWRRATATAAKKPDQRQ